MYKNDGFVIFTATVTKVGSFQAVDINRKPGWILTINFWIGTDCDFKKLPNCLIFFFLSRVILKYICLFCNYTHCRKIIWDVFIFFK